MSADAKLFVINAKRSDCVELCDYITGNETFFFNRKREGKNYITYVYVGKNLSGKKSNAVFSAEIEEWV